MVFHVVTIPHFDKHYKQLKKKYRSLDQDLKSLAMRLRDGDFSLDTVMQGFENTIYKARIASRDQKKGKSGGFRIVYYVVTDDNKIILLDIYAKAQQENINAKEIMHMLARLED